jgi:hypothetical protein
LAQQVDGRTVEGNLMDSFEQELLAQQVDERGKLVDPFEQGSFTVDAIEQQGSPMTVVEQPSFLVNSV